MNKNTFENRRGVALFLLAAALIVAVIIYFKTQAPMAEHATPPNAVPQHEGPTVAVPDTSLSPELGNDAPDSIVPAVPDSIGVDNRPPDEAGAEDGYWNGYHDGVAGVELTEHDVTSNFPTEEERRTYAENYREGYLQGFREGSGQDVKH